MVVILPVGLAAARVGGDVDVEFQCRREPLELLG